MIVVCNHWVAKCVIEMFIPIISKYLQKSIHLFSRNFNTFSTIHNLVRPHADMNIFGLPWEKDDKSLVSSVWRLQWRFQRSGYFIPSFPKFLSACIPNLYLSHACCWYLLAWQSRCQIVLLRCHGLREQNWGREVRNKKGVGAPPHTPTSPLPSFSRRARSAGNRRIFNRDRLVRRRHDLYWFLLFAKEALRYTAAR